jgi:hypothetical protein
MQDLPDVRLVLACQLHKIPSGCFKQYEADAGRNPWPLLGPPQDQWELGERIHALCVPGSLGADISWAVWGNDRGAGIMVPWPSGLSDEAVTTPLPLAPERYIDVSTWL